MASVRAKRVKRKVKRDLRSIVSPEEAKEVLEEIAEEVEKRVQETPKERIPGATVGGSKTAYGYGDLVRMFPIVTFIPEETILLTYQGVPVQAYNGVEMHVPECFKKIYDNHRKELREHARTIRAAGLIDLGVMPETGWPSREAE